jgi:hypothetical protein
MTYLGCQYKVKHLLKEITRALNVEVNLGTKLATIESDQTIKESDVLRALQEYPKYTIGAKLLSIDHLQKKTWWQMYKPVLLIFMYLIVVCSVVEANTKEFMLM